MNLDAYVTRAQAAVVAGANPSTISNWQARGWISPTRGRRRLRVKRQRDGTLRYRLGDIIDADRDTRLSGHSRRPADLTIGFPTQF